MNQLFCPFATWTNGNCGTNDTHNLTQEHSRPKTSGRSMIQINRTWSSSCHCCPPSRVKMPFAVDKIIFPPLEKREVRDNERSIYRSISHLPPRLPTGPTNVHGLFRADNVKQTRPWLSRRVHWQATILDPQMRETLMNIRPTSPLPSS